MKAKAYTDGSYDSTVGRYGFGVLFLMDGKIEECCGGDIDRTGGWQVNGEIEAAKAAIAHAVKMGCDELDIYYDYEGIRRWADGRWRAKRDYTKAYRDYVQDARKRMEIRFIHVPSHTGDVGNERADQLAKEGISAPKPWTDVVAVETPEEPARKEIISFSSGSFETGLDGMTEAGRRSLLTFLQKKNPSFRDFQALKTHGMDKYSAMKKDTLMEYSKAVNMEKQLEAAFPKEAHRLSAIRWMLRGLSPDDAIHKVKVDAEIADNARNHR